MKFKNALTLRNGLALSLAAAAGFANAAIDVTAVVSEVSGTLAPVGLIGSAVLLVFVAVKAFKWVRGALS